MNGVHDAQRLKELQALPLNRKIQITQTRIIEWYQHFNGQVCVSFSGGKDSTALLHLARQIYPDLPAVFSNTGLEYPEIQKFVKTFDNVDIVYPDMPFSEVLSTYGYPLISKEVSEAIYYARRLSEGKIETGVEQNEKFIQTSRAPNRRTLLMGRYPAQKTTLRKRSDLSGYDKVRCSFNKEKWLPLARDLPVMLSHYCCDKMKKGPIHKYYTRTKCKPIIGSLAEESRMRRQAWIRRGCNSFEGRKASSQPLSFWTEQDVLQYLRDYGIEIASVYGEIVGEPGNLRCTGCQRTGCVYCAFGAHLEKGETRFQRLAKTHPRQYEYSIGGGQWVDNPAYDPVAPRFDGEWENWNPKKIWVPSKKGLGLGEVFRMVNEIYGEQFYRWE